LNTPRSQHDWYQGPWLGEGDDVQGETLHLGKDWLIGEYIGGGGFGRVWAVTDADGAEGAAKLIPKMPGADRELLIVDVDARNVVPVIDRGEHGDSWVIVMPRANRSLRKMLDSEGPLALDTALTVLTDIAIALADLEGQVVHRDLKPDNVLELDGAWQLADFGISRYAEAATAPETRKYSLTERYAAPEQWRFEHATEAADVYALGVIVFELLAGHLPFAGPDYRQQHLHEPAPSIPGAPPAVDALVAECLYKAPNARPHAGNVLARLKAAEAQPQSGALARLSAVNRDRTRQLSEAAAKASAQQSAAEARMQLHQAALPSWKRIVRELRGVIEMTAPATQFVDVRDGFRCVLGQAKFTVTDASSSSVWDSESGPFAVTSTATIDLVSTHPHATYVGRSHSVWFSDAVTEGDFGWYETAFMTSPLMSHRREQEPFALDPGAEALTALSPGLAQVQVAWPFTRLTPGDLDAFISCWAELLAAAASGSLDHPTHMPERAPQGSWRHR
jgi:serine/threonine-protein kinase